MNTKKLTGSLMLLMTSLIWGLAFIAQSVGMENIEPFTFNGIRFFIGGIVLLPIVFLLGRGKESDTKTLIFGGLSCGAVLFVASTFQQFALVDVAPGKAGFMTALYIIIVPFFGLLWGKKPGIMPVIAAFAVLVGLYFLCFENDSFTLEKGDIMLFLSAFFYAVQILTVDHFSPKVNGVALSCIQFWVCGFLSVLPMLIFEQPNFGAIWATRLPILYVGVMSCGVAYTFQILGQKNINPTVAALIMSLESVFALLGEFVYGKIMGNDGFLTDREVLGCAIVFAAIIIAQLPGINTKKNGSKAQRT